MQLTTELTNQFITWLIIFAIAWSLWLYLITKGVDYINHYLFATVYFLTFTIITIFFFPTFFQPLFAEFHLKLLLPIIIVISVHIISYYFARPLLPKLQPAIKQYPDNFNLRIDYRYLVSKYADIVFQQSTIIVLIMLFKAAGLSLPGIIISFMLTFGLLHLGLLATMNKYLSFYYTISAAFSGLVFPTLILLVPNGYIYSFAVHGLFYVFTGPIFWSYYSQLNIKNH